MKKFSFLSLLFIAATVGLAILVSAFTSKSSANTTKQNDVWYQFNGDGPEDYETPGAYSQFSGPGDPGNCSGELEVCFIKLPDNGASSEPDADDLDAGAISALVEAGVENSMIKIRD